MENEIRLMDVLFDLIKITIWPLKMARQSRDCSAPKFELKSKDSGDGKVLFLYQFESQKEMEDIFGDPEFVPSFLNLLCNIEKKDYEKGICLIVNENAKVVTKEQFEKIAFFLEKSENSRVEFKKWKIRENKNLNEDEFDKSIGKLFLSNKKRKNLMEQYKMFNAAYKGLFISSSILENKLENKKEEIKIDQERVTFPYCSKISAYLDAYFSLLREIYWIKGGFLESGILKGEFLENLLNIGYYEVPLDKKNNVEKTFEYPVTFHNPHIIESLYSVYKAMDEFSNLDSEIDVVFSNVFLMKVLRKFRHYGLINKELCLITFASGNMGNKSLFVARVGKDSSGIEKIHPIRLLEKIITAIQKINEDKDMNKSSSKMLNAYNISILGTLENKKDFTELLNTLLVVPEIQEFKNTIKITWLVKKGDILSEENEELNKESVKIKGHIEHQNYVFDTNFFEDLVKKNQLIFVLDPPELYLPNRFVEGDSPLTFNSKIEKFDVNKLKTSLNARSIISDLYNQILGRMTDPYISHGKFYRPLNGLMIGYLENNLLKFKDENPYLNLYIYTSSQIGFDQSDFKRRNIVRVEKYNGKHLNIIRLNSANQKGLLSIGTTNEIAMNFWQIIKNTRVKMKEEMIEFLGLKPQEDKNNILFLKNIYFSIDYKDWRKGIKITFGINKEDIVERFFKNRDETNVDENIKKILKGILNYGFKKSDNMFLKCFQDTLFTILYSGASNVKDLLFHYLYSEGVISRESKLYDFPIEKVDAQKLKTIFETNKGLFGEKRMYADLLAKSDTSDFSTYKQIELAGAITLNNGKISEVVNTISEACKELNYENSLLNSNIKSLKRWE